MSDLAYKHIFLLNSTMIFLNDIIGVNHFGTDCLTTVPVFALFEVLLCMVVRFCNFLRRNVTSWREHASHLAAKILIFCVLVKIFRSLQWRKM